MRAFVFLIPTLLSAADITSVPNPIALRLEFHATGATSKALSVSCSGYSRLTTRAQVLLPGGPRVRQSAFTRFVGANPNCTPHAEAPFPARRHSSLSGVPESFVQHRRVVLQNVWPGVDVAYEVEGWHGRLTFLLESAASVSSIRLQTSVSPIVPSPPTEAFRLFAEGVMASVRAEEETVYGSIASPVVFRDGTFILPANPTRPVRIVLEALFPPEVEEQGPSAVARDGSLYEVNGSLLRKFAPTGALVYEAEFAGVSVSHLLLSDSVELAGATASGILAHARLDPETGRFLSANTFYGLSGSIVQAVRDDARHLRLIVSTLSPDFPSHASGIESSCVPFASQNGRLPSRSCTFAVTISAEGDLLTSQLLPEFVPGRFAPDGSLFLFRPVPGPALERYGAGGISRIQLQPPQTFSAMIPGTDGTLWFFGDGGLFRIPPGGDEAREVFGISGVNKVVPAAGGGVLVFGTSVAVPGPDPLMDAPCTSQRIAMALVDPSGSLRYATYLPELPSSPSERVLPALLGRRIAWSRYTLDPGAPSRPAIACTQDLAEASPGGIAFLEVRGVPDESPFTTSWANLESIPSNIRGWSIRVDGVPAPILELNKTRLAILVPPTLASAPLPRNGTLEFFYQDRLVQSAAIRLVPPSPRLLSGRLGPFNYTISNPFGPLTTFTNWPTAGEEVRLFVHGSGPTPPRIFYATGQPIPVSSFYPPPGHPPGVYELRFVLPPPPAGPPPDLVSIPELKLQIKVYFK